MVVPVFIRSSENSGSETGGSFNKCDQNHYCMNKSIFHAKNEKEHKLAFFERISEIVFERIGKFPDRCLMIFTMKKDSKGSDVHS